MPCRCSTGDCSTCVCQTARVNCGATCHNGGINRNCTRQAPRALAPAPAQLARVDYLQQWWAWWASYKLSAIFLLMAFLLANSGLPTWLFDKVEEKLQATPEQVCINNIISAHLPTLNTSHVPRHQLESHLSEYIGTVDSRYVVMVGPRGCGKSVGVVAAAQNHTGVIRVTFSSSTTSVYASILAKVCPTYLKEVPEPIDEHTIGALFQLAREQWKQRSGGQGVWAPTVIAEVDRGATDDVVTEVAKAIKRVGSDTKSCRAILVLSDALAAFALPKDDARIKLEWVDDFTVAEAHQFLDHTAFLPLGEIMVNGTDTNKETREHVFEMIGTRPARLEQMLAEVRGGMELDTFVETVLEDARDVLGRLTKPDVSMKSPSAQDMLQLVRELLASPSSSVLTLSFPGVLGKPDAVAPLLKKYHALMYHYPTKTYRFYSPAYYHAAVELFEKENVVDPFAQYADTVTMEEVLRAVATERSYTEDEVKQVLATLEGQWIRTVGDLRVLSMKRIESLSLPPVVTEYLLRIKARSN